MVIVAPSPLGFSSRRLSTGIYGGSATISDVSISARGQRTWRLGWRGMNLGDRHSRSRSGPLRECTKKGRKDRCGRTQRRSRSPLPPFPRGGINGGTTSGFEQRGELPGEVQRPLLPPTHAAPCEALRYPTCVVDFRCTEGRVERARERSSHLGSRFIEMRNAATRARIRTHETKLAALLSRRRRDAGGLFE